MNPDFIGSESASRARTEAAYLQAMTYRAIREGAAERLRRLEREAIRRADQHMQGGKYDLAQKQLDRAKHYATEAGPLEQGAATVRITHEVQDPC